MKGKVLEKLYKKEEELFYEIMNNPNIMTEIKKNIHIKNNILGDLDEYVKLENKNMNNIDLYDKIINVGEFKN